MALSHPSWDDNWSLRKFSVLLSSFFHLVLHHPSGLFPWGFLAKTEFAFRLPVCNSYPACITLPSFDRPDTYCLTQTNYYFHYTFSPLLHITHMKAVPVFFCLLPGCDQCIEIFHFIIFRPSSSAPDLYREGGECLVHSINLLVTLHQWN